MELSDILNKILNQFENQKIIVIGDYMLDVAHYGKIKRFAPATTAPVLDLNEKKKAPGGAGNAAKNIYSLGSLIYTVGFIGGEGNGEPDSNGNLLLGEFHDKRIITGGLFVDDSRPTTTKKTFYGKGESGPYTILIREDEEKTHANPTIENKILLYINKIMENKEADAVVISDYAKGVVTNSLSLRVTALCKEYSIPLIFDPKPPRDINFYKDGTLITPNWDEASRLSGIEENIEKLYEIGERLKSDLESNVLITRGEHGMSLFGLDGNIIHIPAIAEEVFDVTGAGDTVVGLNAVALASGATPEQAALLSNYAASLVVRKLGTSTTTKEEIQKLLKQHKIEKKQIRPNEFQYQFINNNHNH